MWLYARHKHAFHTRLALISPNERKPKIKIKSHNEVDLTFPVIQIFPIVQL